MLKSRNHVSRVWNGVFALVCLTSSIALADSAAGWRALGQRWAVALDGSGRVSAIHDLSFPAFLDPLPIAAIGNSKLNAAELIKVLIDAKTGDLETDRQVDDLVKELSYRTEIEETVFPERWWTTIRWKDDRASSAEAPQAFSIHDLDLLAMPRTRER
jgi:hypothetical protein